MKRFYSSFAVSFIGIAIAFYLGGLKFAYIAVLLAILEISLSFDNAVVNAKVLNTMDKIWQDRFIAFGIPIAVFGMRFVFPILIVSLVTGLGFIETFSLAVNDPEAYKEALELKKELIYAFGGAFLWMVFMDFLFEKKEHYWINIIENNPIIAYLSKIKFISYFISFIVGAVLLALTNDIRILYAFLSAVALHFAISCLDNIFSIENAKSGFMGFLYLEVLDSSFSFDGVIGAFALSNNIFIIMIGLGIGAMFVRSLTLLLVDKKSLNQYVYIEHGAHYAILTLSLVMFYELFHEASEVVTGTIGLFFITLSFLSSLKFNKKRANL